MHKRQIQEIIKSSPETILRVRRIFDLESSLYSDEEVVEMTYPTLAWVSAELGVSVEKFKNEVIKQFSKLANRWKI